MGSTTDVPVTDGQGTTKPTDGASKPPAGDKIVSVTKPTDGASKADADLIAKLKTESESRKVKITELGGENDKLSKQNKQLLAILSGGEVSEDSTPDPESAMSEFKKGQELLETNMKAILLKAKFESKAAKLGVIDPDVAFKLIKDDSRLKVNIATQQVEGMDSVLQGLQKEAPYVFNNKDLDKAPPASTTAPGAKPPSAQPAPAGQEAVDAIVKKADEIGGVNGAVYLRNEMDKLKGKSG